MMNSKIQMDRLNRKFHRSIPWKLYETETAISLTFQ